MTMKLFREHKTSLDDSDFSDFGKIVTGAIKLNTASSAKMISYIQNQPLPDDVASLKTGCVQTANTDEFKKTLSYQSSWMNQFSWLTFSKLLNGGLCRFCVMLPQSDVQHQNTFVTQPFIATPHGSQICLSQIKMTSEVPTLSLPYKLNQQYNSMMSNSGLIYQKQIRTPYIPAKPFRMRLSNSLEITSQVKF